LPSQRNGNRMGDEGKAVDTVQASAALLSFHNAMSRSVITITEFAVSRRQKPVQGFRKELRQLGEIKPPTLELILAAPGAPRRRDRDR
jgi:hypothetical protein